MHAFMRARVCSIKRNAVFIKNDAVIASTFPYARRRSSRKAHNTMGNGIRVEEQSIAGMKRRQQIMYEVVTPLFQKVS